MINLKSLEDIFPIVDISDRKMVNTDEVLSIGFAVEYEEIFLKDKAYYNTLQQSQRNFLRQLPDYTLLHTISLFDEEEYLPEFHKADNFLRKHNSLYYLKRALPLQKEYVVVSFAQKRLPKKLHYNTIAKGIGQLIRNPYKGIAERLQQTALQIETLEASLQTAYEGCKLTRLSNAGIAQLLYEFLSLEYASGEQKNYRLPTAHLGKNLIGPYHLGVLSLYEGTSARSYGRAKLTAPGFVKSNIRQVKNPGTIAQSQLFPLTLGMPFKHAYSCVIQKLPKDGVTLELELEERTIQLPATFGYVGAINKLKEIKTYKELINDLDYTPVRLAMGMIIPDRDKGLLNLKKEAVKTAAGNIFEMKAIEEREEAGLVFFSHLPGNASSNYKSTLTTAFHAVSYLPKESHYRSDNKGYPFTDRFGRQILVDIHNNPYMTNKNGMVIGPSGRGKSFTLNYLVSLFYQDAHLVIIDKGGSYKHLCELLGGNYYDSGQEELFRFNVFVTEQDKKGRYIPDSIHKSFVLGVLVFIWRQGGSATPEEKNILMELIEAYYEWINKEGVFPTHTRFVEWVESDKYSFDPKFERYFDFDSFLLMNRPYAHGHERGLLNAEHNLDLTYEKFSVFDMQTVEKANPIRFSLLCLIITFLNIKKIQRLPRSVFKSFIIDEALSFLKGDIGECIGNLFAEARKENGQVVVVTQGIRFLLEAPSEVQEKIFSNRDFIVMTNHEGYENSFEDYTKLLGFTEKDLELLASVRRNEEVFIRLGSKGMILRIEVSEEEHGVFTTDPQEMKTLTELYRKYKSMRTAIEVFAKQKRTLKRKIL